MHIHVRSPSTFQRLTYEYLQLSLNEVKSQIDVTIQKLDAIEDQLHLQA